MTLSNLEWPFYVSRAISEAAEQLLIVLVLIIILFFSSPVNQVVYTAAWSVSSCKCNAMRNKLSLLLIITLRISHAGEGSCSFSRVRLCVYQSVCLSAQNLRN